MSWTTDRIVGTAVAGIIELVLLWRIWRALRLARIAAAAPSAAAAEIGPPSIYLRLLFCLVLAAVAMGGIIALIAGGLVSLDPYNEAGVVRAAPVCDNSSVAAARCP